MFFIAQSFVVAALASLTALVYFSSFKVTFVGQIYKDRLSTFAFICFILGGLLAILSKDGIVV